MNADERIASLRRRLLRRKKDRPWEFFRANPVITARSLKTSESVASWQVRRGILTCDRLAAVQFDMFSTELLVGRLADTRGDYTDFEYDDAQEYLAEFPSAGGQTGHCELDLAPVFALGIHGLRQDIQTRLDAAEDAAQAEAYESFLHALQGLSLMIEHAAATVASVMPAAPLQERKQLQALVNACRHIAHGPPQSFREAIQLLWFILFGVMHGEDVGLVVPGHIDRTLAPFYEADRMRGAVSREDALFLIESLYLLINDFIPDSLAMSVMVGGRDPDGEDVTNPLSYLCLEALRRTALIYPAVGICWHEGTPEDLVELAIDLIGHGNPNPAFFGDDTIQKGLKGLGVPPDEACHYINSTCVEITPARSSNVWVASPYFPTCTILLEEIAGQVEGDDAAPDFEAFCERYLDRLGSRIEAAVREQNTLRQGRQEHGRKPLQSVFTRDCLAQGRDIDDGGALYNWVECSFVGLANLADSLHVIQQEVYEKQTLSLAELKSVLDADFEGHEPLRQRFLKHYPKYGQDCAELDGLFAQTLEFIGAECAKHRVAPGESRFVPGAFCWVMHERLGRECGATPDGRKAGVPFADGCGPAQGRETCGPTAAILSTTSWDHSPMIGGLAYNMKFNSTMFNKPEGFAALRDLVLTFLRRGGFETQINVVDLETLKDARANPEAHHDLVVRIGGYCDYFTRLSPEMQEEIILRTEFAEVR